MPWSDIWTFIHKNLCQTPCYENVLGSWGNTLPPRESPLYTLNRGLMGPQLIWKWWWRREPCLCHKSNLSSSLQPSHYTKWAMLAPNPVTLKRKILCLQRMESQISSPWPVIWMTEPYWFIHLHTIYIYIYKKKNRVKQIYEVWQITVLILLKMLLSFSGHLHFSSVNTIQCLHATKKLLEIIFQSPFNTITIWLKNLTLIQENLSRRLFCFGNMTKSCRYKPCEHDGCFNTGICFWPDTALQRVLCGKTHCYDAKSTIPAKEVVFFFYKYNDKHTMPNWLFWNKWIILLIPKKQIHMILTFELLSASDTLDFSLDSLPF